MLAYRKCNKYRRLPGDMIDVYKTVHNHYNLGASVKCNFNPFGITRGNKFKLQKYIFMSL